ncbi:MAG: hypothetical protein A3B74_03605 [Candidatus Kerfeldbacteria bacterium RIFCSPHIGHO2_02_FULL_42_14]|uniref:FCP1 homology domain-containing protein n=1 Tax=Candidatus Kerfeldbacteria bacterium RIFCSPHIGHO2_02_FULL_42_14 TaxID=1798540 RepID=A0A1G2ASF0_9BACT|nr:MAG: hypothetical protein A3B74_03605 [Candidatus Kerfeldbacteria bacterium RIFCSPHIGHO2_02_FULL_42_14]OGY80603.1 MAG: hypothetical protein A3E60_04100 [Candidatus Kerfeldbacteria bacterium RIFCSPHIGHO2_12_FULL_42_13]OGY82527.1 MAG: hypothetical protein A3I91_03765 [Candidatus Kerfeldbacteria bacterium RIFCSPLOWO2_02_FULL_42_19]OGY87551.1 MAG: hypothetical protein A3G01_00835 [Candidatus Kerfeldbacteria bacterium RIFCSPLOWO2_12_FULL_43_9]
MIQGILLDLDGVLIKTELETFRFYQNYLKEHYKIILKDSDFKYKFGRKSKDFFLDVLTPEQHKIVQPEKLTELKRELFNTQIEKFVSKVDGVHKLLSWLVEHNMRLALCSQNEKRMIDTVIVWLRIRKFFEIFLSLQDIHHKKPHPEIYLLASKRLGLRPDECIIIEDSKDGIEAAKNAQMICIGLAHEYTPEGYLQKADIQIHHLLEVPQILQKKFGVQ